jgi:hypothetical protein
MNNTPQSWTPLQVLQQVDHLRLHGHIQSRDRLVGQEGAWFDGESPGRADSAAWRRRAGRPAPATPPPERTDHTQHVRVAGQRRSFALARFVEQLLQVKIDGRRIGPSGGGRNAPAGVGYRRALGRTIRQLPRRA